MSKTLANHQIKQQAKYWVCRLNRGLTQEDKPLLIAWLNQNPVHHQTLYKVASIFDNISELESLNGIFPLEKPTTFLHVNKVKWLLALVFTSLIVITLLILQQTLMQTDKAPAPLRTYMTNTGEIKTITLFDGSTITLNTQTKVQVQYTTVHRHIDLLYGEAQFDVEKDASRPFTVTSGTKSFTALGTIFNIQKNNSTDMELVVSEGKVLISEANYSAQQLATLIHSEVTKFDSQQIIQQGEKSIIEDTVQLATATLSNKQSDKELAWQQGMLVFSGETLVQALNEISRYSDVEFVLVDEAIKHIPIAGYFKAGDIEGLLASLSYNFGIASQFNATNSVQLSLKDNS
ncbi:FecR domain-containing protein [Thalassotalea sp. G2M2-11]|uniref:FecR family protein n=1 Tax=Thalassotalea sp. G2M2-11 TaxID=2787627 RepID=UPI0019D135C2|nr:FecR domain-containing protein [Thalassotalea sp. G2M2-11]